MPVVTLFTNAPKDEYLDKDLASKFSALAAMTIINSGTTMTMAGTDEPCAYIKIASIGSVTPEMNKNTCTKLTEMVANGYKVDASRIFCMMSTPP